MFNRKLKKEVNELRERLETLEKENRERKVAKYLDDLSKQYNVVLTKIDSYFMAYKTHFINVNGVYEIFEKHSHIIREKDIDYDTEILNCKEQIEQELKASLYETLTPKKKVGRPKKVSK